MTEKDIFFGANGPHTHFTLYAGKRVRIAYDRETLEKTARGEIYPPRLAAKWKEHVKAEAAKTVAYYQRPDFWPLADLTDQKRA